MQGPPTEKANFAWVARIKKPILDVMQLYIPEHGGELAAFLATAYPGVQFEPTAAAPELVESINAHCKGLPNVQPGRHLDPAQEEWHMSDKVDAIIATHLAQPGPWEWTLGLMAGAGKHLVLEGWLFLYGPFLKNGKHMADSDEAYDTFLQARNSDWGYRDMSEVVAAAEAQGSRTEAIHDMPATNLMLVFRKVS